MLTPCSLRIKKNQAKPFAFWPRQQAWDGTNVGKLIQSISINQGSVRKSRRSKTLEIGEFPGSSYSSAISIKITSINKHWKTHIIIQPARKALTRPSFIESAQYSVPALNVQIPPGQTPVDVCTKQRLPVDQRRPSQQRTNKKKSCSSLSLKSIRLVQAFFKGEMKKARNDHAFCLQACKNPMKWSG